MTAGAALGFERSRAVRVVAAVAALLLASCAPETDNQLPATGADKSQTSVSGISSGAYMAGQFQMAEAEIVIGAGIIAGGPYGCAESAFSGMVVGPAATMLNASKAVSGCMLHAMAMWGVPDPGALAREADYRAERGEIGAIDAVKTDRIYLFSGTEDRTVMPAIVTAARDFYKAIGIPDSQIRFVSDMPAGHAFVTESAGAACSVSGEPYVVDCDYDQARDVLTQIYGPLSPPSTSPSGQFQVFDQRPYSADLATYAGLADVGVVYLPEPCKAGGCRVHIAFHGCAQSRDKVGDAFVVGAGFARWADTNRIVLLFPQVRKSAMNPQGCWDWWGYTGRDFLTKLAPQIVAVSRMLDRLASRDPI